MRIAQVAPLFESVPPRYYGGTERVVSFLTEELVRRGHQVTLFASGDSMTRARLVAVCNRSLRLDGARDPLAHHVLAVERVFREAARFDIIHFHLDYLHYPLSRRHPTPAVTTLHGRLDLPDLLPLYEEYQDMPVVSISDAQRMPLPWLSWQGTVHHGLPRDLCGFHPGPGKYLVFLGRISEEKRPDIAIRIATEAGMPLKLAAKVDAADREYFRTTIRPLLDHPLVDFLGEVGQPEKEELLGNAIALLFPIDWPEPFGLVMIESMACGTPVVAFRRGSVPEVIDDGVTGWIVDGIEGGVKAVQKAESLDRRGVRRAFETRFTDARMAEDYLAIYDRLIRRSRRAGRRQGAVLP